MYAKLFSRITESSLMEKDITVRYVFVMLLAISDASGLVVGTDIAIARRLNISLEEFKRCIAVLQEDDPDSNSKEHNGKRIMESDGERGYQVINYVKYRMLSNEKSRREYMREYMRKKRTKSSEPVSSKSLQELTKLTPVSVSVSVSESVHKENSEKEKEKSTEDRGVGKGELLTLKEFSPKLATARFIAKWQIWMNHRRAFKKPKCWLTLFNEQIEWLEQFTEPVAYDILCVSIRNGYQGLFAPRQNNAPRNGSPSIFELKEIVKVKEERAAKLRSIHCAEVATGDSWTNQGKRQEYFAIKKEIQQLKHQIESYA